MKFRVNPHGGLLIDAPIETPDILIVRNDRLGDAILALPVVPVLRDIYPGHRIHFWASPPVAPLMRCVEGIDNVISGPDTGSPTVLDQLRELPIGVAYCLRPTYANAVSYTHLTLPTN